MICISSAWKEEAFSTYEYRLRHESNIVIVAQDNICQHFDDYYKSLPLYTYDTRT